MFLAVPVAVLASLVASVVASCPDATSACMRFVLPKINSCSLGSSCVCPLIRSVETCISFCPGSRNDVIDGLRAYVDIDAAIAQCSGSGVRPGSGSFGSGSSIPGSGLGSSGAGSFIPGSGLGSSGAGSSIPGAGLGSSSTGPFIPSGNCDIAGTQQCVATALSGAHKCTSITDYSCLCPAYQNAVGCSDKCPGSKDTIISKLKQVAGGGADADNLVKNCTNSSSDGLSAGAIAGIVVGISVFVLAAAGLGIFLFMRRRKQNAGASLYPKPVAGAADMSFFAFPIQEGKGKQNPIYQQSHAPQNQLYQQSHVPPQNQPYQHVPQNQLYQQSHAPQSKH